MKLLLYYLIICSTYAKSEDIERKYFQKGCLYTLQRVVLDTFNKDIVANCTLKTFKFNRTRTFVNGSFDLLQDVNTGRAKIIGYRLSLGDYKRTAVEFSIDLCKACKMNSFGLATMFVKNGNFTNCPIKKGNYYFHNLYMRSELMPPGWPPGEWKLEVMITTNEVFTYKYSIFITVEYPF